MRRATYRQRLHVRSFQSSRERAIQAVIAKRELRQLRRDPKARWYGALELVTVQSQVLEAARPLVRKSAAQLVLRHVKLDHQRAVQARQRAREPARARQAAHERLAPSQLLSRRSAATYSFDTAEPTGGIEPWKPLRDRELRPSGVSTANGYTLQRATPSDIHAEEIRQLEQHLGDRSNECIVRELERRQVR